MKTYGRLRYGNFQGLKVWGVSGLEPHVAIAFKRLFAKIQTRAATHILSDTDDTRADLEWFMLRYPLDIRDEERRILADGAARVAARFQERMEILSPAWSPIDVPNAFREPYEPYVYQEQAAALTIKNGSLLLCDDVGLGKTITAFTTAARGAQLPMVIVVQPHLVKQWEKRAREFTFYRVHAVKQTNPYRLPDADLYIFSYTQLFGWLEVFASGKFRSVVFDEIQELRHGPETFGRGTKKGTGAMVLCDKVREAGGVILGLTATPIYNYRDEIHTVMSFVNPDVLGQREEFLREWCTSSGSGWRVTDPDALGSFLDDSGYRLRRDEDDPNVDRSMPKPNIIDIALDYDEIALAKEEDILRSLAQRVLSGNFNDSGQAARELDIKMRHITGVVKARPVAAYVEMLLRDHERILLTGWHRDVYDIWISKLWKYNPVLYTGTESKNAKDRNAQRFCTGDSRVMIISNRSGAGLDGLQYYCHQIVKGELDYSPQVHKQLIGRLRRPGQLEQVTGHYPHVNGGSDPVLMGMLGMKADQSRGILDPGKAAPARYTDESRIKQLAQYVLEQAG